MQRLLLTEVKCELQASEGNKQMLYHSLWELVTATQELVQFHIAFSFFFFLSSFSTFLVTAKVLWVSTYRSC